MTVERRVDYYCLDSSLFQTVQLIKSGAQGHVYLVEEKETKNRYVAKQLIKFDEYSSQKYFVRELDIFVRVTNSCIIGFKGFSFSFNKVEIPTIFLEYAECGSIRSKLVDFQANKPDPMWTPTKRMISLLGVAYGMMQLHKNNVIHRDLKPDNVLLDKNYHPKITDFGLSKFDNKSMEQSVAGIGTPFYMAPEVMDGFFTNSVDVYAFGIMAYEIITLRVPYVFKGQFFPFIRKVASGHRPQIKDGDMNDNLKDLLERCWNKNPSERPTFEQVTTELLNPEYFLPDVDENEFNEYVAILQNEYESSNSNDEANQKIKKADDGDLQMMKIVADSFFEGKDGFAHDERRALHYYRLYSMNIANMQNGRDQTEKDEQDQISLENNLPYSEPNIIESPPSNFENQIRPNSSKRSARAKTVVLKTSPAFASKEKMDYLALTKRALQIKITNFNIIVYGNKEARTPVIHALCMNQMLSNQEITPNFLSHRISGYSVSLYESKNIGLISEDDTLNFIKEKTSSKCPSEERVRLCIYCLIGDEDSILTENDERIIKYMSKVCLTAIIVLHSTSSRFIERLFRHISQSYMLEDAMSNLKNAKKGPCIVAISTNDENFVFQKIQNFINFLPNIM